MPHPQPSTVEEVVDITPVTSCRIYSYGAKTPDLEEQIIGQMRLANRYRNALVEMERERRERSLNALRARFPDIPALEAEYQALTNQLEEDRKASRQQNALQRKRRLSKEEKQILTEVRQQRRQVYARLRERKAEAWADPDLRADLQAVENWLCGQRVPGRRTRGPSRAKQVRGEFTAQGLRQEGYQPAEASMQGARKGPPPRFKRFTGEGKLSLQIQGGMSPAELLACEDGRVRLKAIHAASRYYQLWFRVGSEGRQPIWAKVPLVLHRDLPADARIQWVSILRRQCGTHWRWQVQFTLKREEWPQVAALKGACGVDLGWRQVEGGLRVAYWVGQDADEAEESPARILCAEDLKDGFPSCGELILSDEDLCRWHKADEIASIRAKNFNAVRDELTAWLRKTTDVPDWLRETLSHLHVWRSPARLEMLLWRWHGVRYKKGRETPWQPHPDYQGLPGCGRFAGDETIFPRLWAWRKQDKHLYDWQEANRQKAVRWRDDLYCNFARTLADRYRTVVFEKTNWRELQEVPEVDEDGIESRTTNHRIAAVGRLRQLVRKKTGRYVETDPTHTTTRCHSCGAIEEFDAARELEHTCQACGETWDQDQNAALNLLDAASDETANG